MKIKPITRKLAVAGIYFCSAALALVNLIQTGANGTLTGLNLGLTIAGVAAWGTAAAHNLYRKNQARNLEIAKENGQPTPSESDDKKMIKGSTHDLFNSLSYGTAASFFLAMDLPYIVNPTLVVGTRLVGSFLWLKGSALSCYIAKAHTSMVEIDPTLRVKPAGLDRSTWNEIIEAIFLAAGGCYAASLWLSPVYLPVKIAGNFCWLIGGTHDTIQAYFDLGTEDRVAANKVNIQLQRLPVVIVSSGQDTKKPSGVVIEVLDKPVSVTPNGLFNNNYQAQLKTKNRMFSQLSPSPQK